MARDLFEPENPMTREQVIGFRPYPWLKPEDEAQAVDRTRTRMQVAGVWSDSQVLGRRSSIGCVALEITQRCNLDCTLCYLSENSESVKDIPIEEVFRRIDQIKLQYGPNTDVQITGGDPTLRKRSELVEIVKRVRERDMRPTLMTNGIAATRDLLEELVGVGLNDIALHVDLTEERKGYPTEISLNEVRSKYIERVRGLPLAVIFNTTVFEGNFDEIPELVRFFRKNADVVGFASFQLQADTGRGALRKRGPIISLDTVREQIQKGCDSNISFDSVRIGHPRCHKYGITLQAGDKSIDVHDDPEFFSKFLEATRSLHLERRYPVQCMWNLMKWLFGQRHLWRPGFRYLFRKTMETLPPFLRSRGKLHKLTFFAQNFMDAAGLEEGRIQACSFMVMTGEGPISMCMHNAKRDEFILKPVTIAGNQQWNPLTGRTESVPREMTTEPKEKVL